MTRALVIVGTRPEAIKLAPVVRECRRRSDAIDVRVCLSGQHDRLLAEAVDYFSLKPEVRIESPPPGLDPARLAARLLDRLAEVISQDPPDCTVVQGDTTSAMAAAMAGFYSKVPVVHVEAGLRTGHLSAPWPEEWHRRVITLATALHCAPTERAVRALIGEGVEAAAVRLTGNPVIDALQDTLQRERGRAEHWQRKFPTLTGRRVVLVTAHRRESFGPGLENICRAVDCLAERFPDCTFVYPVHLNPRVQEPVYRMLGPRENILLVPPAGYPEFVWLMDRAELILTDSGGVQEEAPTLGTPVLVMREVTERPEAVEAGAAQLVGISTERIVAAAQQQLSNPARATCTSAIENPYGDGRAAERIVDGMVEVVERK